MYRVGRSMFETEKLPAPLVAHAQQLDEVLVPSQFSVDSFSSSGIPLHKLHTLPQVRAPRSVCVCVGGLGAVEASRCTSCRRCGARRECTPRAPSAQRPTRWPAGRGAREADGTWWRGRRA